MAASRPPPAGAGGRPFRSVLRPDVVKACIKELVGRRIHPTFAAYLCLKRQSLRDGTTTDLRPAWNSFFDTFLSVPDGPPRKPYLRPFWDQQSRAGQIWLNPNIAGSLAPSSLRSNVSPLLDVVDIDDTRVPATYSLKPQHWRLALSRLASSRRVLVVPLAAFLYRDYAIETEEAPALSDLVSIFRYEFGYDVATGGRGGRTEFTHLYEDDSASRDGSMWFIDAADVGA